MAVPQGRPGQSAYPWASGTGGVTCPLTAGNRSVGCRPASGSSATTTGKGCATPAAAFPSKSAARAHYRDVIEPGAQRQAGRPPRPDYTDLVDVFLERHAIVAKPRTITELRWRLKQSEAKFGTVPLAELEGMSDEIAGVRGDAPGAAPLPAHGGVPAGARGRCPIRLHDPEPGEARRAEPDAATAGDPGLHPRRADGDHRRTRNGRGGRCDVRSGHRATTRGVGVGRAQRRRQGPPGAAGAGHEDDPLTARGAADERRRSTRSSRCRPRLDSRYVFTTTRKCPGIGEPGPFDVANFRRRVWGPAIDAAGIAKPARLYDLRSTFASNALAAGITMFELARIMGTQREDDRAALRHADRHRARRDPVAVGCGYWLKAGRTVSARRLG